MQKKQKKIALVTGSSIRIGAYIVRHLAKGDFDVAIHYNNSHQQALNLQNQLKAICLSKIFKADLSKPNQALELFDNVFKEMGEISLLINNASIFVNDNIKNLSLDIFQQHLNVHLTSSLFLSQKIYQQQIKSANIINIIDCCINQSTIKFLSYHISKSAIAAATKSLALSMAPKVRVNSICPGPCLINPNQSEKHFKNLCQDLPMQYSTNQEEICLAIDFILNAKSMTGQFIFLDGGMSIQNGYNYI